MECAQRTDADKKGGHLAVRKSDSRLILRESAQCADEDTAQFQGSVALAVALAVAVEVAVAVASPRN